MKKIFLHGRKKLGISKLSVIFSIFFIEDTHTSHVYIGMISKRTDEMEKKLAFDKFRDFSPASTFFLCNSKISIYFGTEISQSVAAGRFCMCDDDDDDDFFLSFIFFYLISFIGLFLLFFLYWLSFFHKHIKHHDWL